jgi:hypothetical protein
MSARVIRLVGAATETTPTHSVPPDSRGAITGAATAPTPISFS